MFYLMVRQKDSPGQGQPLLYCRNMTYAVTSHHIHHLLGIWYDAYDVTSWAMAIGGKPLKIAYQSGQAYQGQLEGPQPRSQWTFNAGAPVFPLHRGEGIPFHRDI